MKDIDFDELDRAVSSLMSNVPRSNTPVADEDDVKVVTLGGGSSSGVSSGPRSVSAPTTPVVPARSENTPLLENESELSQVKEVDSGLEETAPAPVSTPASAPGVRRGRFMDVVRPSARSERKPFPASAVSRQGVTLQPSSAVAGTESSVEEQKEPEALASQPEPETYAVEAGEAPVIDTPSESLVEDTMFTTGGFTSETETTDDPAPLNSPFLPDAKVEKRPLGRSSAELTPAVDLAAELAESTDELMAESFGVAEDTISPDKDAQLPEQPLPAELDSELLSIETSTENLPQETPVAPVAPVVPSTPAQSPMSAPAAAQAMAVASIPQQYKVQPSQNQDAPTGAIYDTQPLAHPAEKKPGWLWVVAILVILLLGAGGGAAVYYLGLL